MTTSLLGIAYPLCIYKTLLQRSNTKTVDILDEAASTMQTEENALEIEGDDEGDLDDVEANLIAFEGRRDAIQLGCHRVSTLINSCDSWYRASQLNCGTLFVLSYTV
jgi:hypothetical protein